MKKIFLLLFVFQINIVVGQDIHFYYNVYKDSLWALKNGKPISEYRIRKDKQVYFHLVDYNNYIYAANFEATLSTLSKSSYQEGAHSVNNLIPGLLSSLMPGGAGGGMPFMGGSPIFGSVFSALSGMATGKTSRGEEDYTKLYQTKLEEVILIRDEINASISELNRREKSLTLVNGNPNFVQAMLLNPAVAPHNIKDILNEFYSSIFLIPAGDAFTIQDVHNLNNKLKEIPKLANELNVKIKNLQAGLGDLKKIQGEILNQDQGTEDVLPLFKQMQKEEENIIPMLNSISNYMNTEMKSAAANEQVDYASKLQFYFLKYIEFRENSFSYTHHVKAGDRFLQYKLNLFKKDSMGMIVDSISGVAVPATKVIEVEISTYGDFHFSSSYGLNASRYSTPPKSFVMRNNVITGQPDDAFVPMIATAINMSYQMRSSWSPALAIGMGIPVSGSANTDHFAFFGGPGVILGKKQNFVISAGFMFSKVNKLASGFSEGQTIVIGDGQIPTEKKYALGHFLGFSYSQGLL